MVLSFRGLRRRLITSRTVTVIALAGGPFSFIRSAYTISSKLFISASPLLGPAGSSIRCWFPCRILL
jgi:hypothetical protein